MVAIDWRRLLATGALLALLVLPSACANDSGSGTSNGGSAPTASSSSQTTGRVSGTAPTTSATRSGDGGGGVEYSPDIKAADFVAVISNRYLPFKQGASWTYEGETDEGVERIEVRVLPDTRNVMGVVATAVRDTVTLNGELVEDTLDWYAQDKDGNVWYLGEAVKNYENGQVVDTQGSWEAGIDGALPGIVMWAEPQPGDPYRQEYYKGKAEDMAQVLKRGLKVSTEAGAFKDMLLTKEWTPLEPEVLEQKYYAPGVGLVREETVRGGSGTIDLVLYQLPD